MALAALVRAHGRVEEAVGTDGPGVGVDVRAAVDRAGCRRAYESRRLADRRPAIVNSDAQAPQGERRGRMNGASVSVDDRLARIPGTPPASRSWDRRVTGEVVDASRRSGPRWSRGRRPGASPVRRGARRRRGPGRPPDRRRVHPSRCDHLDATSTSPLYVNLLGRHPRSAEDEIRRGYRISVRDHRVAIPGMPTFDETRREVGTARYRVIRIHGECGLPDVDELQATLDLVAGQRRASSSVSNTASSSTRWRSPRWSAPTAAEGERPAAGHGRPERPGASHPRGQSARDARAWSSTASRRRWPAA